MNVMNEHQKPPPSHCEEPLPPPADGGTEPQERLCPRCGQPLVADRLEGVSVEVCSEHGVWVEGRPEQVLSTFARTTGRLGKLTAGVLCVLQILGVSGAVVAAVVEIESILWTGPVFSFLGLLVALGSRTSRSASNALFGLSAAVVSVFWFVWIVSLSWGPNDAQVPVSSALIGCELLVVPVGWVALYRTLRSPEPRLTGDDRPWQFGISGLLVATAVLAVALGVGRMVYDHGHGVRLAVAVGLFVLSGVGTGITLGWGLRPSGEAKDARSCPFPLTTPESACDTAEHRTRHRLG